LHPNVKEMAQLSGLTKLVADELRLRRPDTGRRENIFDILASYLILNYERLESDIHDWMQRNPDLFRGISGPVGHTGAPALGVESFLERLTSLEQQVSQLQK
jgi:hypothetical protein